MTKNRDQDNRQISNDVAPKKKERQQREANALRENLKRRKQQLKAREDAKKTT